jgi:hypothetical protein
MTVIVRSGISSSARTRSTARSTLVPGRGEFVRLTTYRSPRWTLGISPRAVGVAPGRVECARGATPYPRLDTSPGRRGPAPCGAVPGRVRSIHVASRSPRWTVGMSRPAVEVAPGRVEYARGVTHTPAGHLARTKRSCAVRRCPGTSSFDPCHFPEPAVDRRNVTAGRRSRPGASRVRTRSNAYPGGTPRQDEEVLSPCGPVPGRVRPRGRKWWALSRLRLQSVVRTPILPRYSRRIVANVPVSAAVTPNRRLSASCVKPSDTTRPRTRPAATTITPRTPIVRTISRALQHSVRP